SPSPDAMALYLTFLAFVFQCSRDPPDLHSFPTRRSSDLDLSLLDWMTQWRQPKDDEQWVRGVLGQLLFSGDDIKKSVRKISGGRSEEHTSELQSRENLVCRLLLEKKKKYTMDWNEWKCEL